MNRRADLLDHLAPWSTPFAAGALACLAWGLVVAAAVCRLAATAPLAP